MAEDPEKEAEEEKLELTPEGETMGYIGMDQAQVRAMQVATETPGDYGGRFSGVSMAFEIIEAVEDEDYYTITLSFRPQGDFAGSPGREQFFFEKAGGIAHRQVLGLPRLGRGFPGAASLIVESLCCGITSARQLATATGQAYNQDKRLGEPFRVPPRTLRRPGG